MSVAGHHLPIWFDEALGPDDGEVAVWNAAAGRFESAPVTAAIPSDTYVPSAGDAAVAGIKTLQGLRVGRTMHDVSYYASVAAAITAAGQGGGLNFRPDTTYTLTGELTPLAKQLLRGAPGTVLKTGDGGVFNTITITNRGDIEISDIEFDLNRANVVDGAPTVQAAIYANATNTTGIKGLKLRRLKVRDGIKWGIRLNCSAVDTNPLDFEMEDIEAWGCGQHGVRVNGASRFRARNVRSRNNDVHGMTIESSHNFELDAACEFYANGDHGLTVTECYDFGLHGSKGRGNGLITPGGSGQVLSRGCVSFRVIGTRNEANSGPGLNIDVANGADLNLLYDCDGTVIGNISKGSTASEGYRFNRTSGLAIVGNIAVDNQMNGMVVNGRDCVFEANVVTRNRRWGMNFEDPGGLDTGRHVIGASNRVWGNNIATGYGEVNYAAVLDKPNVAPLLEGLITVAASGAAQTLVTTTASVYDLTLTANCTLTLEALTGRACQVTVVLRQDGTGGRTVTWPASVKWGSGAAPTLSSAIGAVDMVTLVTVDGGANWLGAVGGLGFA